MLRDLSSITTDEKAKELEEKKKIRYNEFLSFFIESIEKATGLVCIKCGSIGNSEIVNVFFGKVNNASARNLEGKHIYILLDDTKYVRKTARGKKHFTYEKIPLPENIEDVIAIFEGDREILPEKYK